MQENNYSHRSFVIYDSKAEAYHTPVYYKTAGLAIRAFTEAAMQKGSAFALYPADFTLFETGYWDEQQNCSQPHTAAINLGNALALLGPHLENTAPGTEPTHPLLRGQHLIAMEEEYEGSTRHIKRGEAK